MRAERKTSWIQHFHRKFLRTIKDWWNFFSSYTWNVLFIDWMPSNLAASSKAIFDHFQWLRKELNINPCNRFGVSINLEYQQRLISFPYRNILLFNDLLIFFFIAQTISVNLEKTGFVYFSINLLILTGSKSCPATVFDGFNKNQQHIIHMDA